MPTLPFLLLELNPLPLNYLTEEARSQSTRAASRGTTMGPGAEETNDSDADDGNASISYPPLPILLIIPFRHDVLDLHLLLRICK